MTAADLVYTVDTTVLVYAHDPRDDTKRSRAQMVMQQLGERRMAVLPVQVLAEFANVGLNKLRLEPAHVLDQVNGLSTGFPVLELTATVVSEALRGVREHRLAYYDAQIWAAARLAGAHAVLTEDFPSADNIEGVSFVDPFALDDPGALWGE